MFVLSSSLYFPPPHTADADGVLAMGGCLSVDRLLAAYRHGCFPWFSGPVPLWWHPNPRFVLIPRQLKVSKSMKQIMRKNPFQFTVNTAFADVIAHCKTVPRPGQDGTWITDAVEQAYLALHHRGHAISFEARQNGMLVGGLYGVLMGRVFFGESMFSTAANASKFAFIQAVDWLISHHSVELIDCQVYTDHLASLGAVGIPREEFVRLLSQLL